MGRSPTNGEGLATCQVVAEAATERSICAVLALTLASTTVSKAWQAAKDNLPASIPAIAGFDIAAIVKQPGFAQAFSALQDTERDLREGLALIQSACKLDVTAAVDGVVIAGDPDGKDDDIMAFVQLKVDRAKASACFKSVLEVAERRKQIVVKQDGTFTEVSVNGDTAYFAWVAPNVVAFNLDPGSKPRLQGFLGKQGLAKAPVGKLLGKLDPKAVASGAIKLAKPLSRELPIQLAYGNALVFGGNVTASIVGTVPDPKALPPNLAELLAGELAREARRSRTPPILKKILEATSISVSGADITARGTASTKELGDAVRASIKQKKRVEPPMPPSP